MFYTQSNTFNSNNDNWQTKTAGSLESAVLIQKEIEYIFSEENLKKDLFLHDRMDTDGWVDVKVIANYRQIKSLTNDVRVVAMAAALVDQLEFSHCQSKLRKERPANQPARNMHRQSERLNSSPCHKPLINVHDHCSSRNSSNIGWQTKAAESAEKAVLIKEEIKYIFSDKNMNKDRFLHDRMDFDGWVDIKVIANYRQIKSLTNDVRVVAMAAALVDQLEFSYCGSKLRKTPANETARISQPRLGYNHRRYHRYWAFLSFLPDNDHLNSWIVDFFLINYITN